MRGAAHTVRFTLMIAVAIASVVRAAGVPPSKQSPTSKGSGGGTQWMSPAVVATWITEQEGDAPVQLQMLILWRGTTGWFLRPGGSSSSGNESVQGDRWTYRDTIIQGGVRLAFEYDSTTKVATVQGQRLELQEENVVFVDDVDSPGGARVTGTLRVPRPMPGSAGQIGLVLRASPQMMSFLRCDASVPEGPTKALIERLCLQNVGVVK